MKQHIELYIDRLVLNGFLPSDRFQIGDTVEQELARLFSERGLPPSLVRADGAADIPLLQTAPFQVDPSMKATSIGREIAQTVYSELSMVQ